MSDIHTKKELQRLVDQLQEQVGHSTETHLFLYSSLLGLNGLLISAFAIMVSINPNKYHDYILPYLASLFLAVTAILTSLLMISRLYDRAWRKTLFEISQIIPEHFSEADKTQNTLQKQIHSTPHQQRYENVFRKILDFIGISLSFINMIILFIVIYYA